MLVSLIPAIVFPTISIHRPLRRCAIPSTGIMCDMLWADPCPENGRNKSKRGVSIEFGPDVAAKFLDDNGLSPLTRSARPVAPGQGGGRGLTACEQVEGRALCQAG